MDYLKTLSDSVRIWWNNKYLWVIGIIGAIFGGFSYSYNNNDSSSSTTVKDYVSDPTHTAIIILIMAIVFIVMILIIAIKLYLQSRADSAIYQSTQILASEKEKLNFSKSWALGKKRINSLIGQTLLLWGPVFFLIFIGILMAFLTVFNSSNNSNVLMSLNLLKLFFVCLICIAIVLLIYLSIISTFARRYTVLENVGAFEGITRGNNFFLKNLGHIIVYWLAFLMIAVVSWIVIFIINITIGLSLLLAIMPIFLINPFLAMAIGFFALLAFLLISVLIEGPIYSLREIYWTNVYLEIQKAK